MRGHRKVKTLNIIIPIYNDKECVNIFYDEVSSVLHQLENSIAWHLTFVEDASRDGTLDEIKKLAEKYGKEKVRYIANSRRFGKDASIYAGMLNSDADYTAVMDCDLQDPPALIPNMIDAIEKEGYDCCATFRSDRHGEPVIRSMFSRMFYSIMAKSISTEIKQGARDFRLMNRRYVRAALKLCERERFTKGIFSWVGFKTKWISFANVQRVSGETKMSFKSLAMDAIGAIVSFTVAPLRIAFLIGCAIIAFAIAYIIYLFIVVYKYGTNYSGVNTVLVWNMLSSGFIILLLGIIGEYIARIYFEIKRRPIFLTRETNIKALRDTIGEDDSAALEKDI